MNAAPVILFAPLLLLLILLPIALLVYLIIRVGKNRPGLALGIVAALVLLLLLGAFFFVSVPHQVRTVAPSMGRFPPVPPVPPVPAMARWVAVVAILPLALLSLIHAVLLIFLLKRAPADRRGLIGLIVAGVIVCIIAVLFWFALSHFGGSPAVKAKILPLAIIGIIAAAVIAFAASGKKARIAIAAVAIPAFVILPVLGLFFARVDVAHNQARNTASEAFAFTQSAVWHESLVDQYPADVYPSRRSAARALGIRLAAALEETLPGRRQDSRVCFTRDPSNPGLMEIVAEGYGNRGGTMTFSPSADHEVVVTLEVTDLQTGPAPWSSGTDNADRGTLQAVAQLKNGASTVVTSDFIDKPWVDNISAFLSRDPSRQFALVRSYNSSTTREEARAQAVDEARSRVLMLTAGTRPSRRSIVMNSPETLIVDSFSQRLSGGLTGPIYREALLVDISPERLDALVRHGDEIQRLETLTWARHAMTLAGMLALITAVYVFLNAATRGYYTWALRTAVVCAAAAAVLFLFLFA